jgi:hypothetical protein
VSDPEFQKILVLSTVHVTQETMGLLDERQVEHLSIPYEYGSFVWVPGDAAEVHESVPGELKFLLGYAKGLGCEWLRLDCDGPVQKNLAQWEW